VLALACAVGALLCALVVMLRSVPEKVRAMARNALQIAEETQDAFRVLVNRNVTFMEEITRERESAAGDLEEAEHKRRVVAAKVSKLKAANPETNGEAQQQSFSELMAQFPPGDPRRLSIMRQAKVHMGEDPA